MINILIATHGPLAEALKESARMFFGDTVDRIISVGLHSEEGVEEYKERIRTAIKDNYDDDGMLIFVDIFAGTPFNTVAMIMDEIKDDYPHLECFSGVNLTLLMEALGMIDNSDLKELAKHIEEMIPTAIVNVKKVLEM